MREDCECEYKKPIPELNPVDKEACRCTHSLHPYAKASVAACHTRFCPILGQQEGQDLRKMSKRG